MILAIDTSTAACTAALLDSSGTCMVAHDEVIGRGHAERLAPMLDDMLDGRQPGAILVGVGPGSFTGIRVGLAAAHGLAIGWNAEISGMSSLALLAASALSDGPVAAAMNGGHGELFVQAFDEALRPQSNLLNLAPEAAAAAISTELVVGPGARSLVDARGSGRAVEAWPAASAAMMLPQELRTLAATPVYARAPDAKARHAA